MGAPRNSEELSFLLFFVGVSSPPSETPGADKSWKGEAGKDRGTDHPGSVKLCLGSPIQGYTWHHI